MLSKSVAVSITAVEDENSQAMRAGTSLGWRFSHPHIYVPIPNSGFSGSSQRIARIATGTRSFGRRARPEESELRQIAVPRKIADFSRA